MQAYKCDECGEFKEGEPTATKDAAAVGRYVVAVAVGIKMDPAEEEPEVEENPLDRLFGSSRRKSDMRVADLCDDCATSITRQSILAGERALT